MTSELTLSLYLVQIEYWQEPHVRSWQTAENQYNLGAKGNTAFMSMDSTCGKVIDSESHTQYRMFKMNAICSSIRTITVEFFQTCHAQAGCQYSV